MKKNMYIIFIIIITTCLCICFGKIISNNNEKISSNISKNTSNHGEITMKAIILEVFEEKKQLLVCNSQNTNEFIYINYSKDDENKFKENQEIIIYYDGIINTTYPERINNIKKIEIIDNNISLTIQDETFNLDNNINISINRFDINEFTFMIKDTNEIPYVYLKNYKIYKEIKNDKYVEDHQKKEATNTSTSSYSRFKF